MLKVRSKHMTLPVESSFEINVCLFFKFIFFSWEKTRSKRESGWYLKLKGCPFLRFPSSNVLHPYLYQTKSFVLRNIYSELNALKYSPVFSEQKNLLSNKKSFLTPDNCIRWGRRPVVWLLEDLNIMLIIYGSLQHIVAQTVMFECYIWTSPPSSLVHCHWQAED